MNCIKKYYPMAISIIYLMVYAFLFGVVLSANSYLLENNSLMLIFLILSILVVIAIFAEIIGFIIHAAKNNNGLWALWIYLFNIFVIPYYNLKYVFKEKDATVQMTIFVSLLVVLTFGTVVISIVLR